MKTIIIFLSVVLWIFPLLAQEGEKEWNFDRDQVGLLARGFVNEMGEWKIVGDSTAPSQPHVLAQAAKNSVSTFNIALVKDTNYKDLEISVRMKALAGKEDQGGGLIWRAKDSKNYYLARFNPLENNFRLYKVEKGRRTLLKSAEIKQSEGWHRLTINVKGDHMQCYFDGKKVLEGSDSTFRGPGRIGLWTKADAQSYFDDLTVREK